MMSITQDNHTPCCSLRSCLYSSFSSTVVQSVPKCHVQGPHSAQPVRRAPSRGICVADGAHSLFLSRLAAFCHVDVEYV